MKKYLVILMFTGSAFLFSLTLPSRNNQPIGVEQAISYYKKNALIFADCTGELKLKIEKLDTKDSLTIIAAKEALLKCRLSFKNIEFFFNYFFRSLKFLYNAPAVIEVEEPYMEYREPIGLQVIAGLLFSPNPINVKTELLQQIALINESASDLNSLLYNIPINDNQILESIRIELINVLTLGIAGFDTPELKTGIIEAGQTLKAIKHILTPYLQIKSSKSDSVEYYLEAAINLTEVNTNFKSFNRLQFLTEAALPLQYQLKLFISKIGLEINTTQTLNYKSDNIFQSNAIRINESLEVKPEMATLGKRLFFENALSGNNTRSCATCHQPEKYFTDGLPGSIAMDGKTALKRNSPTLLYTSFQYSQFWDGRVKSLEDQIKNVLNNPDEMNGDEATIVRRLMNNEKYKQTFSTLFKKDKLETSVNIKNIATAIAVYIKTLTPFNSPFDNYLKGNKKALDKDQVNGFNLFMGKAMCGTCHVAPIFNGLTAPLYDRTTLEVIGTTSDINFKNPHFDKESGRYESYPIKFYIGAFKTPSLRNVTKTAPYMHNGAFPTLESVLEFYNKGGGKGLGLNIPNQTLPADSLRLNTKEIESIIAFLRSLTDNNIPQ